MVSKNNQWQHLQASAQRLPHYGLRKLSVGVASVLLSTTLYMGVSAHADTVATPNETVTPAVAVSTSGSSGTETTGDVAGSSVSGLPASSANSVSGVPTSQGTPANPVTTSENSVVSAVDAKVDSEVPAKSVTPNASDNKQVDLALTGDRAKLDSSSGAPMWVRFMSNNQANDENVGETQVDKKLILQYVDDTGLPVGYQTIPARTNGPTTISLMPPEGYVLADGESDSLNVNYDFTTDAAPDISTFVFRRGDHEYDFLDVAMRYSGNGEPLSFKVKRIEIGDPYAADKISISDVDPNLIKDASGSVNDSTTIYHNISYSDLSDENGLKYPFNQSNTAIYIDGKDNVKTWLDALGANQKGVSNGDNPFDSNLAHTKISTAKYQAGTFDRMLIFPLGEGSTTNTTGSPQHMGVYVSDFDADKGFYVWFSASFNFKTGLFQMFEPSSSDYLPAGWNYNNGTPAFAVVGYETTKLATLTWTIHYVDENGNKLAPDTVVSHDYQRIDSALKTGTFEMGDYKYVDGSLKVTGTNNTGYHIDAPDFKYNQTLNGKLFDTATWQVAALKFDGYHVDHDSLAVSDYLTKDPASLGSTSHDYSGGEFTFHYVLNPKTVTINYVNDDDNEKVVGTGTVSGKPNTEVTITPNLPSGYMLTPGKAVPSTYTVTGGDNQAVTIHVQKQLVDVSATDPQAKQTRTITLHYVYAGGLKDGQPAFDEAVLDVYYHRTATLDRATNQTTYGDWTWDQSQGDSSTPGYHVVSGKWTNLPQSWATVTVDVPSVKGYYADLGQNDPTNTNHVPANTWVFPTYNNSGGAGSIAYLDGHGYEVGPTHTIKYVPNQTTVTVNYVDDDNNGTNVGSQHWDGTTGQHIDLTLTPPTNYVLSPGWVNPSSYDFDGVNSSWYTVHVKHATQDVTDQQPNDQVNKTETLTRKHLYGPGPHEGEKFGDPDIIEVPWHRTAAKDLVTGKVSFGDWHVVWDEVKQLSGATKMWGDVEHNWINGGLMADYNGYSYLGAGAKTKAITTDGTVIDHYGYAGWIWIGEQDIEKNPTIVQYYGRDKVWVPINYVDFDTNQQLETKRLTGDDFLDGNTITVNKSDLADWNTNTL